MKIIIHAPKDKMILAARTAQRALGLEERSEWPANRWIVSEYENGDTFTAKRNRDSITVFWQ